MSLSKIKDAILQFSFEEREELNRLLYGWKQDRWDNQIGEDVAPDGWIKLSHAPRPDLKAGRTCELP